MCIVILQYLWEQFRDEVNPFSSAEHTHVDSEDFPFKYISQKSKMPFRKLSLWQLFYSYLLTDIHTMSQGRTATKNKHLPPDILHLSSNSHTLSVAQGDYCFWLWHLGLLWFSLLWPALLTLRVKKAHTHVLVVFYLPGFVIVNALNTWLTHCHSLKNRYHFKML